MTWESRLLGELVEFRVGKTPARANERYWSGTHPWLSIKDMNQGLDISTTKELISDLAVTETKPYLVPEGTVLLSFKLSVGKVGIARRPLFTNEAIAALVPRPQASIDSRYLLRALQYVDISGVGNDAVLGVTLNRAGLEAIRIPLPPLPEQRRIAATLDDADGVRRTFARGGRLWQSVTESILRSAVSSARGFAPLGSHLRETQNGLYKPSSEYGSGTPIIRIDSFGGGIAGVTQPLKRVRISESERAKFLVAPGQILVNRVNALSHLGKSTLIQDLNEPTVFESNMMRLDLATSIEPRYVFTWLTSADARAQIRSRAKKAINQASINQTDVAELRIPSVSIEKQRELVSRLAEIERVRAASQSRAAQLDALFASLQHRAFRGEL